MPRPGSSVSLLDTGGSITLPSDTGTWFASGLTDRGPVTPTLIQSINDFVTVFGARQSYSVLYDAVDCFFREGGNKCYISRVVGPSATSGFKNLLDSGAGVSLIVTAIGPGAWSSSYKVQVLSGTNYRLQIQDSVGTVLEDSGDLFDQNAAINWALNSKYVRITLGATALVPNVAAAAALSAGTDDRGNIVDAQWQSALDKITVDFGPGQVSQPGRTTTTAFGQLESHALANNRVALLDCQNTPTVATLQGSFTSSHSRFAAGFAPWIVIPGLVVGTTRVIPPSALVAGLIARNDASLGTNRPSAGNAGVAQFASDVSQPAWSDSERSALSLAGVNVIRRFNGVRVYGWRSTVDPNSDPAWIDFANSRLYMQLSGELGTVAENYMFEEIDGQNGNTVNGFHDALAGVLMGHYNNGEFFGDSPDKAFSVDTSPTINTLATIQALELHAVCYVKMAPFAEYVAIQIVKQQLTS